MKNRSILIITPAIFFCWCFFSLQGCKEPIVNSKDLLTKGDNLNLFVDTVHLKVSSEFEKPLTSSGTTVGALGSLYDPSFGSSYASFYAHCQVATGIYFGQNSLLKLDSAVLTLRYNGQYGLCTKPVDVSVFELNQDIYDSVTYYTNNAFQVKTPAIGQLHGFVPDLVDSVSVQGVSLAPHMRIPLTQAFGNKILLADSAILSSPASFLTLFKGFYITTSSSTTGNGILYLNLPSSISGITLYYHNDTTATVYTIPIAGATIDHFDNSYNGTPVYTSINSPNPNGEQKMYIQAGAGVKGKILITNLDSLARKAGIIGMDNLGKKVGINKAELILSQSAGDTLYAAPLVLSLYRIDDGGFAQLLEDESTSSVFGGTRLTENINGVPITRYRFNITRYFQRLVQGVHSNKGFYLQPEVANTNLERVVIGNSSIDQNYKVTLIVTYTKL